MKFIPALQKMMSDIKEEPSIPPSSYQAIRYYLHLMYVVGWEEGRESLAAESDSVIIGQYNYEGKLIATYKNITQASRQTGFPAERIKSALNADTNNRRITQGWVWKRIFVRNNTTYDPL